jgi:hypothetical protein
MPLPRLAQLEARYVALRGELAGIGDRRETPQPVRHHTRYLSQGSVYRRPVGQPGTRFTWSTKVKAKTVSLALSQEQADWLEAAIVEHQRVKKLLTEMRRLSRQIMRARFSDTERRRPLNKRVLRLI